ncbi:MAG: hypothetical protein JW908_05625 [Anaerolineales bacterium]|nr:hypothetical protein [Anaerolineales bacterium]
MTQDSMKNIRQKIQPPPAALNFPAAETEKVQKKMSTAQKRRARRARQPTVVAWCSLA